jgi:hypothetical protein
MPIVDEIASANNVDALGFEQVVLKLSCGHNAIYAKDIGFEVGDQVWCHTCYNLKRN